MRLQSLQHIGAAVLGALAGLFFAPAGDFLVVTTEKDVGHFFARELGRARVLGPFEEAGSEGVVAGAEFVAEHAGKKADDGVDKDGGGERAIGEDVVADADFVGDEGFADAFVHALVVATDDEEMRFG